MANRKVKYQVWHYYKDDYTVDIGTYDSAMDALSHVNGYDSIIQRYEIDENNDIHNYKVVFASDGAYYRTLYKRFRNSIYRYVKRESGD